MKKIKSFFKKLGEQIYKVKSVIKGFFEKIIVKPLAKLWTLLSDGYEKYVSPIMEKIAYYLSHNFILKVTPETIRLFGIKFKNTRKGREIFYGFMFISLWLIGFLVFTLYPLIYSFYLTFTTSFFHVDTGITSTVVGFKNYLNILQSQVLLPLYVGYVGKMILAVPLVIIFSMIIAMLINQPIKGKGIWRTIFFLPVVISTGPVINELRLQGATTLPSLEDNSIIKFITDNMGSFIADPMVSLLNSLLLVLWYAGIPILIFLAALQKIDKSIYEASSIDGASPWDNFWKITLPSIKPFISINIIYVVVSMSLFVEPGGILELTRIHMTQGNVQDLNWFGYGYAASMAWIYFILMLIIMGFYIGLVNIRRKGGRL